MLKNVPWYYFVIGFALVGVGLWWWLSNSKSSDYRAANLEKARAAKAEKAIEKVNADETENRNDTVED